MNGNSFRTVKSGDPLTIPATAWNDLMAMRNAWRQRQLDTGGPGASPEPMPTDIVLIKNTTASVVQQYGVLGIDTTTPIDPSVNLSGFKEKIILNGVAPASGTHEGKFAITLAPILAGEYGPAVVSGVVICQVDMVAATDKWAEIKNSTTTELKSAGHGSARILFAQSGTGVKWCIVRMCERPQSLFPVLIKSVGGSDGTQTTYASWTYDLYPLGDTSYTNKINSSALQPLCSRARYMEGKVVKPSDGDYGEAFYDASGNIVLWDLPEKRSKGACT